VRQRTFLSIQRRQIAFNVFMKTFRWVLLAVVVSLPFAAFALDDAWHPAIGPLKTRWTDDVSPKKVWSQYPRPQMARKEWLNLNGVWDYTIIDTNQAVPTCYEGRILVPFPVESALSGVMRRLDEKHHLIYHRTFTLPKNWAGKRILLNFGAVDWQATVFVNGNEAGTHRGGYDPFSFDITDKLKPGAAQEIRIDVFDPTEGQQARGKQVRKPEGIWYTPTSGIWQTVWLEPVGDVNISGLKITPDIDNGVVRVSTMADGRVEAGDVVEISVRAHGREVARGAGSPQAEIEIPIPHAKLWSPAEPFLYDLKVELRRADRSLADFVTSYFGMRKISLGKNAKGVVCPLLNNKPIFQIGTLDQGFWPDGLYAPPSDAAMRYDLEVTKKLGFNMVRKHVKVEPDRWYYYCDKLGLLVWQDMPGAYLGNRTDEAKKQFEEELTAMIDTHYNHPCISTWVLFNEGWGQYDTERLAGLIKQLDSTRLLDDASGWTDKKVGDIRDRHKYPAAVVPELESNRACVQGEFGGLALAIDGHTWTHKTWGYQSMGGRPELTKRYVDLLSKVLDLKNNSGLTAAVYTQITDVETECNGLMTYDRAILKPDAAAVAEINRKLQADNP
jgi:hypothetical protein